MLKGVVGRRDVEFVECGEKLVVAGAAERTHFLVAMIMNATGVVHCDT